MGVLTAETKEECRYFSQAEIKEMFVNLTKKQWDDINKRLTYYFFKHYERDPRLDPEDLISSAILDLLEGRRHWRPEKADLVTCLCGAMRSNASHILENRKKHPLQSLEEISESVLSKKRKGYSYFQACTELRNLVRNDRLLSRIVEYFIQDPELKPRDLPDLLSDVPEIARYNVYRRLNKLIRKLK